MTEKRRPIRAGIAGAGLMGFWHARTIEQVGGQVSAVLDPNQAAAQELARRFPKASSHTGGNLPAGEDAEVDVWHICTPLESHAALAESALSAGQHCLVEKPIFASASETERLLRLAAERKLLLCPVHQFPFQDGAQETRRRLAELEPLTGFHYAVRSAGGEGQAADIAAQIAAEILPHPLSLIAALMPGALAEISWQVIKPQTAEWLISGQGAGIGYTIAISMNGRPTLNECQVVGRGGTAHLDLFHGYAFFEKGAVSRQRKISQPFRQSSRQFRAAAVNLGRRTVRREPAYPGLRSLIGACYQGIQSGAPAPISPQEILAIAQAQEQIQRLGAGQ